MEALRKGAGLIQYKERCLPSFGVSSIYKYATFIRFYTSFVREAVALRSSKKMAELMDTNFGGEGVDERFVDVLMKALERKNLEGFDYLEFKQSIAALSKMGITGDMAIKSAFATGSTMGLTIDKLLNSAAYYQQVLLDEKAQFELSVQRFVKEHVEGKRQETTGLKKQIADWQTQIDRLKAEITKAEATIGAADAQISEAKQRAAENQARFEATLRVVTAAIQDDMDEVKRILG